MALSEHTLRRVAAEAGIDVRTVRRIMLRGEPARSLATYTAIEAACVKLGVAWVAPTKPSEGMSR